MNRNIRDTFLKQKLILFLFVAIVIIFGILFAMRQPILVLSHQQTNKVFFKIPFSQETKIIYKWVHSLDHIPWNEYYTVTKENHFLLNKIEVAAFGAGVPENKGDMSIENGMIVMKNVKQGFKEIRWIHSQSALQKIIVNSTTIRGKDLPHHQPLQLTIQKEFILWNRSKQQIMNF